MSCSVSTQGKEDIHQAFNTQVLSGCICLAYLSLTNHKGVGVLQPDNTCTKLGSPVLEVLQAKHHPLRDPPSLGWAIGAFEQYNATPTIITMIISANMVASKLSGISAPEGLT